MAAPQWIALGFGLALVAYGAVVLALILTGRRMDARAIAGFVLDCLVLLRRLIADPRVARRHKLVLAAAAGYLMLPFDLVPDFVPVVGYVDDALVVALAVRLVLNGAGPGVITQHWRGPERSLRVLLHLADASLWPRVNRSVVAAGIGALGLTVCVWVDVADNCSGAFTCREDDPMLLITGRGISVAFCVAGVLGLVAREVLARRRAGYPTRTTHR